MLPTTNTTAPRPGSRFRSARNKSVMQKASDMVATTLTWSTRNARNTNASYNAYKKQDGGRRGSGGDSMITIDTSYLSNNVPFTDTRNWPGNSKSTWQKVKKQVNRKFLDKPWLLPTLVGSSFVSAIFIIFFVVFSHSSQHSDINMAQPTSDIAPNNNNYHSSSSSSSGHGAHRTMRKKNNHNSHNSHHASSYHTSYSSMGMAHSNNKGKHTSTLSKATGTQSSTNSHYNNNNNMYNNNHHNQHSSSSSSSMEKSVDHVFSLFHNNDANRWVAVSSLSHKYCGSMPNFDLENDEAFETLKGNIGTLIFDIVKFNPVYTDLTPNNVAISKKGTFVADNNNSRKRGRGRNNHQQQQTGQCGLVSHLFQLADDLGMLTPTTKDKHDFDTDANEFWKTHETDIDHKTINEDVAVLFDHASNNHFYEISMELPRLVSKHCPHTETWIQNQGNDAEEHFYNSLSRAIFTVHNTDTSETADGVTGFPVIDSNGDLMQVDSGILQFDSKNQDGLHYSRCELLDKIVFHGLTMSMNKHIDFMYDAAAKDDYYGFEILADLLDTEYCEAINTKLTETARNDLGLHLWSLTKDIINGEFHLMGDIDDVSNEYVITTDGGIVHNEIATHDMKLKKSQIIHCSMVKELIKRGIKYHSGNHDYNSNNNNDNNYDVDEFEHRYDNSGLSDDFYNEIKGVHSSKNQKQLKQDAKRIIDHLQNGEETEFVKLLDALLDQYHSQWFNEIGNGDSDYHSARSIKLMIEQSLHSIILGKVSLEGSFNPENDMTILRKDVNELEVVDRETFPQLSEETHNNLETLPLLDEIFKQVMEMNNSH